MPGAESGKQSEIIFGGVDANHHEGKIHYVPVRRKAYWEVPLDKVRFGEDEITLENTGAAIDTGTSLIALPSDLAEMLNMQIGAKKSWSGQYTLDCATIPSLPDLTFTFGGRDFPISASDYVLNVQGNCISAFMGLDMPDSIGPLWVCRHFCSLSSVLSHRRSSETSSSASTSPSMTCMFFFDSDDVRETHFCRGRDAVGFATAT